MGHEVDTLTMVVEIPTGSRNKYEVDHRTGEIFLDRRLFTATRYPADYGYVPDTLAEDGDPLDVLALVAEPTFPGCRIRVRPLGLFLMEDQGKPDHKVLGVPVNEPLWAHLQKLEDVPGHVLREMQHFFSIYKDLEQKKTAAIGWRGLDETRAVIEASRHRARAAGH